MRFLFSALIVVFIAGCASLAVAPDGQYPFRAEFVASGVVNGKNIRVDGALCVTSDTAGAAQIYGPGGLTAYTLTMQDGLLSVFDTWGRPISQYDIPLKDIVGVIAGTPPRGPYLYKRKLGDVLKVTYTWGNVWLGENMLPREVHLRGDPRLDAVFYGQGNIVTLLITYGSDTLDLAISVKEGGRWL